MIQDFLDFISAWKIWHALFHDFIWWDWSLLLVWISAIVAGALRGFSFFLGKLLYLLILIFSVMLIYPAISHWAVMKLTFAKADFWQPFFFFTVALLTIWILSQFSKVQSKKSPVQFHVFWDRILGMASGFFAVLLVASLLSQFLLLLPAPKIHAAHKIGHSRFGSMTRDFVPQLVEGVLTPIRSVINQKVPRA